MNPTANSQVVLVGMSTGDWVRVDQLAGLAAEHQASFAFLQMGNPSLHDELTRLAEAGADNVVLVGVCTDRTGPGISWLRRIAAAWWREHPDPPVLLTSVARLTEYADPAELVGTARPVTGAEPGLTCAAWQDVPRHRHHVLVCRGPRCTAAGSEHTAEALDSALRAHGLGDDDALITRTGCLFPCNHSPVVSIQPDDTWYGQVDVQVAQRLVSEHLVGGGRVAENQLPRQRS